MRILHVYKDFDPPVHGGIERHMALMCRFQREWAEVRALTCSRRLRTIRACRNDIEVREVGEWGRFQSAPVSPMFPFHLWAMHADVNVVHVPNPTAELSFLLSRPRGRLVVRYQSDVVRQAAAMKVYRPFLMKFLSKADIILAASERYLNTSSTLQPFRHKCRVVPLGIVPEEFADPDPMRVQALREKYRGGFVLFSGRHRYYKGLDYLVKAAHEIDAPVVIAGTGPERSRIEALAQELRVKIDFVGALSHEDLVAHLHACDVVAFPSIERSEAFGLTMLEAHATGTPVVATTLGTGVEFVNLHEETGLNVPPRDAEALAAAINALLHNSDLRARFGARARARVRSEFDARRIARAEFEIYQEVAECPKIGI
ncbi:MAG: glycosyltransferase [Candidatus Hydrogenedentes bacterium]|nr:glycosyltransferase [Candidatus Hydrogenedentota bacterium]